MLCLIGFSHVASIAAGNAGVPVVVNGLFYGRASGMAPRARSVFCLFFFYQGYIGCVGCEMRNHCFTSASTNATERIKKLCNIYTTGSDLWL